MISNQIKQEKETALKGNKKAKNYSLCRASCAICPYRTGLLKLLDHGVTIVPTLPESG